jgi:hypothetical protein
MQVSICTIKLMVASALLLFVGGLDVSDAKPKSAGQDCDTKRAQCDGRCFARHYETSPAAYLACAKRTCDHQYNNCMKPTKAQ